MNKSIQVSTRESNSLSQRINLYKSSREGLTLCIDLYKSPCKRLFYVSTNKPIQVFTRKAIL